MITKIKLEEISSNPRNPRKNFNVSELVDSIKSHGVLEPIIVRLSPDGKGKFEIVAGERRFRASLAAETKTIPAIVKALTDDEAFDIMTIENLQRHDLTEMEEAESFKAYSDQHGDGIEDLATRTGIKLRYIKGRIKVLSLPKYILKQWDKGKIVFGHLEQFMRIDNKTELKELFSWAVWSDGSESVRSLKNNIDRKAVGLKYAKFDLKEAGCHNCQKNTHVQKELFNVGDLEEACCLDSMCYFALQDEYLKKNWKKLTPYKTVHTQGYAWDRDVGYGDYEVFYSQYSYEEKKPSAKCMECESFITLLDFPFTIRYKAVCVGDQKCFKRETAVKTKKKKAEKKDSDGPRVAWHGEHFREEFFKGRIPERFGDFESASKEMIRMAIFALVKNNDAVALNVGIDLGLVKEEKRYEENWGYRFVSPDDIFEALKKLDYVPLLDILKSGSLDAIMLRDFNASSRLAVAQHLGIDLKKEWLITQEYLEKKTKAEMFEYGEKLGILTSAKAKKYLEKLGKKRFEQLKKGELIDVFLKSGVNLSGKVPDEILNF
jgi:ParB/RepB/Spo0J family partition protein